jgi:transposase InsO family protein
MFAIVSALLGYALSWLRLKHHLALENLALRHQIAVPNRQAHKPKLQQTDRWFWVVFKGWWPNWRAALMIFQPETVIGWQRAGFRMFWRWKSRPHGGRPRKDAARTELIRRMWTVKPNSGSPRIRDELTKLSLEASTATIRKYRPKSRRRPSQSWWTFLQNHAGTIAAIDFFLVPTVTFRLLYVLLVMNHERHRVVHFNITDAPTVAWTAQQVTHSFSYDTAPKYRLRDRDSIYGTSFVRWVDALGIKQKLISPRSPWQSLYVERLVGSIRRECLDRVIVFNERQLRQILGSYFEYYKIRPHPVLSENPSMHLFKPPRGNQ